VYDRYKAKNKFNNPYVKFDGKNIYLKFTSNKTRNDAADVLDSIKLDKKFLEEIAKLAPKQEIKETKIIERQTIDNTIVEQRPIFMPKGNVEASVGKDGVGFSGARIEDGKLILIKEDGEEITAGDIPKPDPVYITAPTSKVSPGVNVLADSVAIGYSLNNLNFSLHS